MARRKVVRMITAARQERINRLAKILYAFLPLSSVSKKTVTFRTIFAESRIDSYLSDENKGIALRTGLTKLFRYHERLPKRIITKVVPAAIEWRRHKRRPLTRAELDDLAEVLAALGVDMRGELAAVELNEALPRITVPPTELLSRLEGHDVHPVIATDPLALFRDGHFNEAVRKAAERFEDEVRDRTGLPDHGTALMGKAFGSGGAVTLVGMEPENEKDFQDGFKFLAMGMMAALRNVFSHGNEERRSPEECFEMLMFVNWLFRGFDTGTVSGSVQ